MDTFIHRYIHRYMHREIHGFLAGGTFFRHMRSTIMLYMPRMRKMCVDPSVQKPVLRRVVQHRAKRQASIGTGCAAPCKVTHSSPNSLGCTAHGGPHRLIPPESSITLIANASEPAGHQVVEENSLLARQRAPLLGFPNDGFLNLTASR